MGKNTIEIVIPVAPITKKNHQQIVRIGGRPMLIPSKQYREYEKDAVKCINYHGKPISTPVNVKATFYMKTRRRVDLVNLQEALLDVLVMAGVLGDDNRDIVGTMDGSLALYDKEHPRTEVIITPLEDYDQWKEVTDG